MRRSVRSSTTAASRPAVAPRLTDAANSLQRGHAQPASERRRKRRADGRRGRNPAASNSRSQRLGRWPGRRLWQARGPRPRLRRTAHFVRPCGPRRDGWRWRGSVSIAAKTRRAIGLEFVEGAAAGEVFEHLLIDLARVQPSREIGEARERPLAARTQRCDSACPSPTPLTAESA